MGAEILDGGEGSDIRASLLLPPKIPRALSMKAKTLAMALPGPQVPGTPGSTYFTAAEGLEIPTISDGEPFLDVVKKLSK